MTRITAAHPPLDTDGGADPRAGLSRLLLFANLAGLVLVVYLARSERREHLRWESRRASMARISGDAAFITNARSDPPLTTISEAAIAPAGSGGVAADLPAILRQGGVDATKLISVIPEAPRPIADTDLLRISERISLEEVSLSQLAGISRALSDPATGWSLQSLSIRTARSQRPEHWDAEIVVAGISADSPQ